MEKEEAKACAMEIIRQLGGGHFIAMTGACQFVYDHKLDYANVTFKFKGSRVANYCKITLDGSDTYVVEFLKITATALKTVGRSLHWERGLKQRAASPQLRRRGCRRRL